MRGWKRWGAWTLAAGALAAYHGSALTGLAGQNGDDSVYLMLGQAIATGAGYLTLSVPAPPPHVMYPPGYPLLLAGVWALWPAWPANLVAFKALNVLAIGLAAAGLYRLATRTYGLRPGVAALAAAITALSGGASTMVDLTMAELPYMAAVVGALLLIEPRVAAGAGARAGAIAGLLVGGVMAIKTIGFTLGAACAAWLGVARRWAALAGLAAGGAIAFGPWALWVLTQRGPAASGDTDYVSWGRDNLGGDLVARLAENLGTILTGSIPLDVAPLALDGRLLALLPTPLAWALLAGVLGLVALGFAATARGGWRVWHVYLLGFTAFVAAFPWHPTRYMTTATPWLALAFAAGCGWLWERPARARVPARLACVLAVALALGGPALRTASLLRHGASGDALLPPREAAALADRRAFTAWARATLGTDAQLVHERQTLAWLDTGIPGVGYFEGDRPSAATLAAFRARPTWVVVFPGTPEYKTTHAALAKTLGAPVPAFRGPAGTLEVYRVLVPPAAKL